MWWRRREVFPTPIYKKWNNVINIFCFQEGGMVVIKRVSVVLENAAAIDWVNKTYALALAMRIFSKWTVVLMTMSTEITFGASTLTHLSRNFCTAVQRCSLSTNVSIFGLRTTQHSHGDMKSRRMYSMICWSTPSTVRPKIMGKLEAFAMGLGGSNRLELEKGGVKMVI